MATIKSSITVQASPAAVFDYIDDMEKNPEWIVGMSEVRDVRGEGVGREFHWTFTMIGIPFDGESTTVEHVPGKRLVTESKGGIRSIWSADLEEEGAGTKLVMEVDYTIPVPVLGKLAENIILKRNTRELEQGMLNIKERLEG